MTYRTRIKYTAKQKDEMWGRWQRGESLKAIGRVFDRPSSSIFGQGVCTLTISYVPCKHLLARFLIKILKKNRN